MIIVMKPGVEQAEIDALLGRIEAAGLKPLHMPGSERVVLGALGDERVLAAMGIEAHPGVESVKPILEPYKLAGRDLHPHDTVVDIGGVKLGGTRFVIIAGPCAVESEAQLVASAEAAKAGGARILRAGAYKARTGPYSVQGMGAEALDLLAAVGRDLGMPVVTEVVETADVERVARHADALQVGARNMQNFALLTALGGTGKPVIMERGPAARVEDMLLAAEYILAAGNDQLLLCERGIRTFETATRNTLDLSAVPVLKAKSHLPVIVDPSHGTGKRELVAPMALAAAAAGADGVMVEVHFDPPTAISDGPQSLFPDQMEALGQRMGALLEVLGRPL